MLLIHPIEKQFTIEVKKEDEVVDLIFQQLTYRQKALISSLTTNIEQGQVVIDQTLSMMFNCKYALKDIKGFHVLDDKGKPVEYKLRFDPDGSLQDSCVDELFNSPIIEELSWSSRALIDGIPDAIIHPVTGEPVEGVSIKVPKKNQPKVKKK